MQFKIKVPQPRFTKNQLAIIATVIIIALVGIFVFQLNRRGGGPVAVGQILIWGKDDAKIFEQLIGPYKSANPGIEVKYEQISANKYDENLLSALASGEGPDIFLVGNYDIQSKKNLVSPANQLTASASQLKELFPQVVEQNFVDDGLIYALPLYIDTLSLIYNRDAFDRKGIVMPPSTWADFQDAVIRLRTLNAQGQIVRAGAAIGGSEKSVTHASDILQLLMLQNKTKMISDGGTSAIFAISPEGQEAFSFYLRFSNRSSPSYTWDDSGRKSFEQFVTGNTMMAFAYNEDINELKRQNPFLSLGIAKVPQTFQDKPISFARYEGLAVSKQSKNKNTAWSFITFVTTNNTGLKNYLEVSSRTPATRGLIQTHLGDGDEGVFAIQALTARSWRVPNDNEVSSIFNEAILNVLSGEFPLSESLKRAQARVGQLLQN